MLRKYIKHGQHLSNDQLEMAVKELEERSKDNQKYSYSTSQYSNQFDKLIYSTVKR
jgi:hypothetical protein